MNATYIKIRGKWTYLYRAVNRDGQILDFMLSEGRDTAAARQFFKGAIAANGVPNRVVIDKSGANLAGLQAVNVILKFTDAGDIHNAATSRELTTPHIIEPAKDKRKIVIIGAGPAGLEAARVAAERGHDVVVFEAHSDPGGQVRLATQSPHRREMISIID